MTPRLRAWMQMLAVPALVVDLIHAVQLNPAVVDLVTQHFVHAPIRPFAVRPHRRRKHDHPGTGVTDDLQVHVFVE